MKEIYKLMHHNDAPHGHIAVKQEIDSVVTNTLHS
jgi:hypothetical protein